MTAGTVLVIGDSISNGDGPADGPLPCRSWGVWVAAAGGWQVDKRAKGGYTSTQIVRALLPREGTYAAVTLAMGTNDLLGRWEPELLERNLATAADRLRAMAGRVLVLNLPVRLGQVPVAPRWLPERVAEANTLIERSGLLVVDVQDIAGGRLVRGDGIHLTAHGNVEVADRAVRVLREHGVPVPALPSETVDMIDVPYRAARARERAEESARWVARRVRRRVLPALSSARAWAGSRW